jgi:hypothetical protein
VKRRYKRRRRGADRSREAGEPDPFDTQQFKIQANLVSGFRAAFIARAKEEIGVKHQEALEPTASGDRGQL